MAYPASPRRLSVVVVIWNNRAEIERSLPPLADQLAGGDELIVVDNASGDGGPEWVEERIPSAHVVRTGANLGFAAGADRGAEAARGELLLFLNPDATPRPGFVEAIRRPLSEPRRWDGWMGLVTGDGGTTVNTEGNEVHFTGISWAGGAGAPLSSARREPAEVSGLSGACLAIPRRVWERVGPFPPEFFMYQEDLDLSLRIRLQGGAIGIVPDAVVDHDYEFVKGASKWRYLERNRGAVLIRTYPGPLLALALPGLAATELGLLVTSLAGGWLRQKLLADLDVLRSVPRLLRERRAIQARRAISSRAFAAPLTPELSSRYLGRAARSAPLRWSLRIYWSLVLTLLGVGTRSEAAGVSSPIAAEPRRERSS